MSLRSSGVSFPIGYHGFTPISTPCQTPTIPAQQQRVAANGIINP
jgi:hypothetical protein